MTAAAATASLHGVREAEHGLVTHSLCTVSAAGFKERVGAHHGESFCDAHREAYVTPDAVIYRYLELISSAGADTAALGKLLSADADLLMRWLKLLEVPASFAALDDALSRLEPEEFTGLAEAQAWSVLPIVGSARLSLDQWMGVLRAAFLAEVLAEADDAASLNPTDVRLRTLLAISGVQLTNDPLLAELNDFRGINPALLEDASLELRIFAVVDGLEIGRESELAAQLLGLSEAQFQPLLETAEARVRRFVEDLEINSDTGADWAQLIWLRQQVSVVTAGLQGCRDWETFAETHALVSRSLFDHVPLVLVQREAGGPLEILGDGGTAVSIHPNSTTSHVAAATRSGELTPIREGADLAVVDRQLLRRLAADEALVMRTPDMEPAVVLVAAADEDIDSENLTQLYAQALARPASLLHAGVEASQSAEDGQLEQFRSAEQKRLREIVHEANNPLSIVHNYLHILQLRLQHEPEAAEQLALISSELRRAADVFATAREVPKQVQVKATAPGEVSAIDVGHWLRQITELHSGYAAERGVPLNTDFPETAVTIHSQQDKLTQILTNLLKNALEACVDGDDVTVGYRTGVYRNGRLGAEVVVADSGPGLPEEALANLTVAKRSSKGGDHQGVGLQVAFALADELDGALDVRTGAGQGTTFTLFAPIDPLTAQPA